MRPPPVLERGEKPQNLGNPSLGESTPGEKKEVFLWNSEAGAPRGSIIMDASLEFSDAALREGTSAGTMCFSLFSPFFLFSQYRKEGALARIPGCIRCLPGVNQELTRIRPGERSVGALTKARSTDQWRFFHQKWVESSTRIIFYLQKVYYSVVLFFIHSDY